LSGGQKQLQAEITFKKILFIKLFVIKLQLTTCVHFLICAYDKCVLFKLQMYNSSHSMLYCRDIFQWSFERRTREHTGHGSLNRHRRYSGTTTCCAACAICIL